jgi:hypothetical protein
MPRSFRSKRDKFKLVRGLEEYASGISKRQAPPGEHVLFIKVGIAIGGWPPRFRDLMPIPKTGEQKGHPKQRSSVQHPAPIGTLFLPMHLDVIMERQIVRFMDDQGPRIALQPFLSTCLARKT